MNTKTKRSVKTDFETKVSSYDRVSSMLVALVMLCGLAATIMFVMWLARNISFDKSLPIIAAPFEPVGTGEFAEGIAEEFEEPGVEELADVPEPQLADAVESLTDAVSSVAANFADFDGTAELMGTGTGLGDSRARGPGGDGKGGKGGGQRWQVHFVTTTLKAYGQQLDYFEIEIGSLHRSLPEIEYARNLGQPKPDRRAGDRAAEKKKGRLWLNWPKNSKLRAYDVQLLGMADITVDNKRLIIQFYPTKLQTELLQLEVDSLNRQVPKRTVEDVLHTHFDVRKTGNTYKLSVKGHDFL